MSGHFLPKKPLVGDRFAREVIDPMVVVTVCSPCAEVQRRETKCISNNGFNPEWNETFQFSSSSSELAMIAFEVFDVDYVGYTGLRSGARTFICGNAVRLCQMRQSGIRWVPLLDSRGEHVPYCGLLV